MGRYETIDAIAVADCALEIEGESLDDLFETAARALAELMVDPATVRPVIVRSVTLTASALDLLLYDWLAELIYLKDSEQLVFPTSSVEVTPRAPWRLVARMTGGVLEPGRTSLRADPKAVTLHRFSLMRRDGGWRARVVIDI